MKVPFFDYPSHYKLDRDWILDTIDQVAGRGAFIMQKELADFEKAISIFTSSAYSIGVGNATDGLELAWLSVGLKPGDEVIISSHTMVATASAIVTAGGIPVPVEIGNDNLISPEAIESAISSKTVGISPTHLNGRTCDMDKIMDIAKRNQLFVIEDAAQALGSKFNGKHAGTFGNASSISLFPAKVLGALGDGGVVLTNSHVHFEKIYQLHDHGRGTDGEIRSWGRNSRLDNLQAAILLKKLENYSSVISRRREIARIYHENLHDIEQLKLPPCPDSDSKHFDVYQNYELEAERRDDLREHLKLAGVGTLIQWGGKAVHQWKSLGFNCQLPRTETFFQKCLMIPMNVFVTNNDVEYVCDQIRNFYSA